MTGEEYNKKIKEDVSTMIKYKVFDTKNGKVTLHYGNNGELLLIQIEQQLYKKIKIPSNEKKVYKSN